MTPDLLQELDSIYDLTNGRGRPLHLASKMEFHILLLDCDAAAVQNCVICHLLLPNESFANGTAVLPVWD